MNSAYNIEGYFDSFNLTGAQLKLATRTLAKRQQISSHDNTAGTRRFEFAFTPNFGFLASPEPLLKDCELKLSFDRSDWRTAITAFDTIPDDNICTGIDIKDCVAVVEYVDSPSIREHFSTIDTYPITYKYEECNIIIKSIPSETTDIRFDNLCGGPVPSHIFIGVCPTANLNGDETVSSTLFKCNDVKEVNITLNGSPVNGYPVQISNSNGVYPFYKFLDATNRLYDNTVGSTYTMETFKYNWLWAYKSEAENTSQGWTGISLTLETGYTTPMSLVVWMINDASLSIDKYHRVEKK